MPRRTAASRHVSHRVIYSPDMPEMPWHAIGSKNSAYAGVSGAHRLTWRSDSVALIAKCGVPLQRGFPILVLGGVDGFEQLGLHGADAALIMAHGPFGQCDVLEAEASDQAGLASWVANIRAAADEMATRIADMLMHMGGD